MKAIELMVGDWVKIDIPQYGIEIIQIFSCEHLYEIDTGECDLLPIPISTEILEKNGFKHYTYNCSQYFEFFEINDGNNIVLQQYPCGYFELHVTDNENYRNIRTPIDYVHQLQHVLRLAEINKEIIL